MRDYGTVSPKFWIGTTGKTLRGDPEAQVLAMYLMTSPHSTMTGVFHCPVLYMAHETGLGMEGASKALARLIEAGFCEYEEASEFVFVVRMAAHQIAESLKPGDKRILGLARAVENMPAGRIRARFLDVYGSAFLLSTKPLLDSPLQAPCKPLLSQEQEQEQEQEKEIPAAVAPVVVPIASQKPKPKPAKQPLPDGWTPDPGVPESLAAEFQTTERTILGPYLDGFRDACKANGYQYADFNAAFRNCVRQDWPKVRALTQAFSKKPPDDLQALFARGAA